MVDSDLSVKVGDTLINGDKGMEIIPKTIEKPVDEVAILKDRIIQLESQLSQLISTSKEV